ncbi:tripartite tricarboxylate transporter substrate binding protein [Variovorax sp. J31P207]|uniref:Bug family tripartite tricarboxylate transporter substrate binding protein n=1 Tax=Variovorax sp. J31P207 TaxID=3053510 RepID=UPI0025771A58|nr:tripartite tricarboxylate transporter substrate binding protein [Variovorax sp. J31P207]MDM0072126.1 tripartite tricarboxylate transporter substrate binding protein [Variovorax sp. J31P207]
MTRAKLIRSTLPALAVAISAYALPAFAQGDAWPSKAITWVAVTAPGGNSDVLARVIGQPLGSALKVPVVVENKPGASGAIAGSFVAKAAPDGYTLLGGSIASHAIAPLISKNIPYDVLKDFAPVTMIGANYNVLVVPVNSPFKTVADVIAAAKAAPGTLSFGSPGIGGTQHMSGELFQARANVKLIHSPNVRGSALTDVMAGHVNMMFEGPAVFAQIQGGKLRALAVTSRKRLPQLPDVPTMEEAGVPNFEVLAWHGVFAPAGTPKPVLQRLQKEIAAILKTPEVQQRLEQLGMTPSGTTPDEFAAFQKAEVQKWSAVVQAAGIKAE